MAIVKVLINIRPRGELTAVIAPINVDEPHDIVFNYSKGQWHLIQGKRVLELARSKQAYKSLKGNIRRFECNGPVSEAFTRALTELVTGYDSELSGIPKNSHLYGIHSR